MTGSLNYTSRIRLNEETIRERIKFLGLSIFHKIHVKEYRPLLQKCATKFDSLKEHNLRSKGGYSPYPRYGIKFHNFFPHTSQNFGTIFQSPLNH